MATMNRNVNLEEIDTDSFMGISYLKYQTFSQKVIFWGSVALGIALNLICSFVFEINSNLSILLTIIPLLFGVAFGCNFNEDLSLFQYWKLIFLKPSKELYSKPTEDLEQIRNNANQMKAEAELAANQNHKQTEEERMKTLIRFITVVVIVVLIFCISLALVKRSKKQEVHHTVSQEVIILSEQES